MTTCYQANCRVIGKAPGRTGRIISVTGKQQREPAGNEKKEEPRYFARVREIQESLRLEFEAVLDGN